MDSTRFFKRDGIRLAFQEKGKGDPVLLIHGFASSGYVNWVLSGWFQILTEKGYRAIAIDNRGHGSSDKSYDSAFYRLDSMAYDAAALLTHLGIEKAHVMGYSMGAKISACMALRVSEKVRSVVFGGLGIGLVTGTENWHTVAEALLVNDLKMITNARAMMFRKFADSTRSDRKALAACLMLEKKDLTVTEVRQIKSPVLVAVGTKDEISGKPEPLVSLLSKGELLLIPERNHMLAVGDKIYKEGVLKFFERHRMKSSF
ncbi:MAG: Hydrolase or acyltransferase [Candidatus Tokpelaia sp. JSC161]|nr:MAG: Hydrolase or acyltransferase [Candidatus Tokpelaia sp. JSC161]